MAEPCPDRAEPAARSDRDRPRRVRRAASAAILALAVVAAVAGCAGRSKGPAAPPLRVAVAPFYPPIVFEQDGEIMGVEAELAAAVGAELGRPIEWVRMTRQELIPAVEDGRVDVAMSGISITPERARRVRFTEPYLQVGQLVLIRIEDLVQLAPRSGQPPDTALRKPGVRIGYVDGTTGEAYVREQLASAETYAFASPSEGIRSLRARRIDAFIHDAPTVWRVGAGIDERELMGLYRPLTDEALAWAVRRDDEELASRLDAMLAAWRETGELDHLLNQWIPVRIKQ